MDGLSISCTRSPPQPSACPTPWRSAATGALLARTCQSELDKYSHTDYVPGRLVFDIGGNKYRIVASVDFDEQILVVDEVMTHQEYNRETI
jgi:mRNA interferase HigB